ncbi:MAG: aldo/keto reductase [Thermoanaerobaculia bacterium]|nr:aldo/keto reductase [Thermoanaerobaculia bacterium]
MKYTTLGKTGLVVSRLALGCMSYGDPGWRPWVLPLEEARPFFRRALEAGINLFDTADMYSLGVSEEVTGRLLREMGRPEELVVATKVHFPMGPGPNRSGLSRKHVVQACEASLRRLGVEAIDLYQVHRFDPATPLEETLEALGLLVRQGKVRYLGASSGEAWRFQKALGLSDLRSLPRFVSMQNHYNLLYREEEREMLPLCVEEGVGVLPWSPLARGLLAGTRAHPGDRQATPRAASDDYARQLYDHPADADVIEATRSVAAARGVPMARVALAWLLSRPGVTAPIVGATKPAHLDEAIAAVDVQLSPEEIAALEAPYRPHGVRGFAGPAPSSAR